MQYKINIYEIKYCHKCCTSLRAQLEIQELTNNNEEQYNCQIKFPNNKIEKFRYTNLFILMMSLI